MCGHISGSGPRRVVFIRGDEGNIDSTVYLVLVNRIINDGFKSIDPFKSNLSKFSFDIDLSMVDQDVLSFVPSSQVYNTDIVKTINSCATNAYEYIFLFSSPRGKSAWVSYKPIVNINIGKIRTDFIHLTAIHESGHALANISDEYDNAEDTTIINGASTIDFYDWLGQNQNLTNCSVKPSTDYTYNDGTGLKWYGDIENKGCQYLMTVINGGSAYGQLYRPSSNSIMGHHFTESRFNVISCGYLVGSFNTGAPVNKAGAQIYWPACTRMDTMPIVYATTSIITVSGLHTGPNNPIFSFVDSILPSIHIWTRGRSLAKTTKELVDNINTQLQSSKRVLVVGHSLGSVIAFNVSKMFTGKNVKFIYVDPPYNDPRCSIPIWNTIFPVYNAVLQSKCNGIATASGTIDWTGGYGIFHLPTHDPFDFPNEPGSLARKAQLKTAIEAVLNANCTTSCSFTTGTAQNPGTLDIVPTITSVSPPSISPENTITITGSGFDPRGNNIEIENVSNPEIYYDIFYILPGANGNLTFILPGSFDEFQDITTIYPRQIIPGSYKLKVSSLDSDWSNELNINIQDPPSPQILLPTTPVNSGSSATITGSNFSLANNTISLTRTGSLTFMEKLNYQVAGVLESVQKLLMPSLIHAQVTPGIYTILNASTTDKTKLSFKMPVGMPSGVYELKLASFGQYWSSPVSLRVNGVPVPSIPPSAPTNLVIVLTSAAQAKLSWTASIRGTNPIAGYKIYNNGTTLVGTSISTSTAITVARGITYSYSVKAYDNATPANYSLVSNVVRLVTPRSLATSPLDEAGNDIPTLQAPNKPGTQSQTPSILAPVYTLPDSPVQTAADAAALAAAEAEAARDTQTAAQAQAAIQAAIQARITKPVLSAAAVPGDKNGTVSISGNNITITSLSDGLDWPTLKISWPASIQGGS
ncbi:MAG: fibronectin type III domain-containing protein, partial [Candidatus Taylorbacteria bacterium]